MTLRHHPEFTSSRHGAHGEAAVVAGKCSGGIGTSSTSMLVGARAQTQLRLMPRILPTGSAWSWRRSSTGRVGPRKENRSLEAAGARASLDQM